MHQRAGRFWTTCAISTSTSGPSRVGFGVADEAGRVLPHQPVWCGLLEAVALLVDRGATRRPLVLPTDDLRAGFPRS